LFGDVDHLGDVGFQDDNIGHSDDLLLCAFEIPCLLGLGPELLDRIHQLFRLFHKSLAKGHGPSQVRIHFGDQFWKFRNRLDVLVPWLRVHLWYIVGVFDKPRGLNYFERVSGGRQHDGNQWIGMQRDGYSELLKF